MKLKTLFLSLFHLMVLGVFAQPSYEWATSMGSANGDNGMCVTADNSGNVISAGIFQLTVDFDPGPATLNMTAVGLYDIYIQKLDGNGNLVWAKSLQGSEEKWGNSIETDASGNIYLTGEFRGTVDFNPGVASYNLTSNGNYDAFVLKLDPNGNFLWAKQFGDTNWDDGHSLCIDNNNNVCVTGRFNGTIDFNPGAGTFNLSSASGWSVFVLKLDANGNFVWAKSFGGSGSDSGEGIAVDGADNVYITGEFQGTGDFDPGAGTFNMTANWYDPFVVKLTSTGDFVWARSFGSSVNDHGKSIDVDNSGNVYAVGEFRDQADFDPGVGTYNVTAAGSNDGYVLKLDANGDFVWVATFGGTGGDETTTVDVDAGGGIHVGGNFSLTVDFDPGPGTFNMSGDAYFLKLNSGGSLAWAYSYNATNFRIRDNFLDGSNNLYLTGDFRGAEDFDIGTGTSNLGASGFDPYVVKHSLCVSSSLTHDVTSLSVLSDQCSVNAPTPPTASTNCGGSINGVSDVTFPITTQGTTTVTWTYDDGEGNTSTQTQSVVIDDVTNPVADVASLSDVTAECEVTSLTAPTATDNCAGSIAGTHDATLPITTQGTTVVTWTYDDGNGNSITQTQNVIIDDSVDPVADVASLSDVTAECEVTSLTAPTATDNCAGSINGTHDATLPITTQGTTVVTWTYDDGNGNSITQTQNVVIDDVTNPVTDAASLSDVTAECEVTSLTAPTATDNCAGSINGTHDAALPITTQGTTVVTWTYDDGNGNTTTQTQNVVIDDVTAPAADVSMLSDITSECEVTSLTEPTATDNCSGTVTVSNDAALPITASGTTVVTWTYDDGNGNTSTQTQNVIITPIDVSTTTDFTMNGDHKLSANATGYSYQWIENCGTSNDEIAGETNIDYFPTANGTYGVIVSNGTCSDTSECIVIDNVAIVENDIEALTVYPNPTFGDLIVDLGEVYTGVQVKITNMLGQVIMNESFGMQKQISLMIDGEPGFYILEISTGEGKTARVNVIKK